MAHQHATLTASGTLHTTDATPTGMYGFASLGSAVIAAGLSSPAAMRGIIAAEVIARGQTSGSVNCYRLAYGFKWASDALAFIGSESSSLTCEEDAAWAAAITGLGDDDVSILCTGDASEHVEWTAFFTVRVDADT